MKGDREQCTDAVAQDFKHAAQEMKDDREQCTAAVAHNIMESHFDSS